MNLKELVLLRKKYSSSFFQKCNNYFNGKHIISEIDLKLQQNMDYDWMLQGQLTKINLQLSTLNTRIREFAKVKNHDKKIMDKLLSLKSTLKGQQNSVIFLQEKHFKEITGDYLKIINYLTKSLTSYGDMDSYFSKMNLALSKSEKKFIFYCEHWKNEQLSYYKQIHDNSQLILDFCNEISTELSENHKNTSISSIAFAKLINLSHYIDNFKKQYPRLLDFKDKFLFNFDIKSTLPFLDNPQIKDLILKSQLIDIDVSKEIISTTIKSAMFIFYEILHESKSVIRKIEQEKRKFHKVAIPSKEFKKKVLIQWLEHEDNSTFFMFSRYIEDHELNS